MSYGAKIKPTMRSIVNARVVFLFVLCTRDGISSPIARFHPLSFRAAEVTAANNLLAGSRETQGVFGGVPIDVVKLEPLTTKMFESERLFFPSRNPVERTWIVRAPRTIITMGCETEFPGNNCHSASLTIGSNRFCGGTKQIGPITAQDSIYIVYRTRVTKSHFKCTVSSSYPVSGSNWSYYGRKGPSRWSETFPFCGGKNQSPVDIDTSRALGEFPWKLLGLHGYSEIPSSMGLSNNGKFVILKTRHQPYVMGGNLPLNQKYLLEGIIFHWGPTDYAGSEHAVNGRSYAAEIQLVHYNSKYGRYQLALNKTDGVAIFSIFLDISARDNLFLDPVILGLRNIVRTGISTDIIPFPLSNLLPANLNEFYRYIGSTSFPSCEEGIIWTIFKNTITISSRQLDEFRFLEDADGLTITKNVRPIQPLNGRTVSAGQLTPSWSHSGPDGQDVWASRISVSCGGQKQSPINIDTVSARISVTWNRLFLRNFDQIPRRLTLQNTDNGAVIIPTMDGAATIEGGPFRTPYVVVQYHFHWGDNNTSGSEHTIDRQRYLGEIHMVVYNASLGSIGEAFGVHQGIYEIAILLEESLYDNIKLDSIISGLSQVILSQSKTELRPFPLFNLLPDNLEEFFFYDGSITAPVPECDESAGFVVFNNPIPISKNQMAHFYNLENAAGFKITNNFRRLQKLNGRTVYIPPLGIANG
ncbi:uncharacterized protein LOC135210267 [Macrobrachium nipponense]|uniref:uncharacterized protein LOC135210267 n=1 Tax=Macrobrachium nipponense TaxID=159736 RepID=UPI0030C805F4